MLFRSQDQSGTSACKSTDPGMHAPSVRSMSPTNCSAGSYSDEEGQEACKDCPIPRFQDQAGQTGCVPAQVGFYVAGVRSAAPTLCENGTFTEESGQSRCQLCSKGKVTNSSGRCQECPEGHFSDSAGSRMCSKCVPGTVQPLPGQSACDECGPGHYQVLEGQRKTGRAHV